MTSFVARRIRSRVEGRETPELITHIPAVAGMCEGSFLKSDQGVNVCVILQPQASGGASEAQPQTQLFGSGSFTVAELMKVTLRKKFSFDGITQAVIGGADERFH